MSVLSFLDIKQAIWDERFRKLFPEYEKEFNEFLNNPSCSCNTKLYNMLLKHKEKLKEYFPTKQIFEKSPFQKKSNWKVINCPVEDLEKELKKLPHGITRQVSVARWQNQVTVIIHELS